MSALTKKQIQLIVKILSGAGRVSASEDAKGFRASNEDALDDLDELERNRVIQQFGNGYVVSLPTIADLRKVNVQADSIWHLCQHLFDVARRMYKENPGNEIGIEEFSKSAEFPVSRVQRGLSYLLEAPITDSYRGARNGAVALTVSENILRYKEFDDVVRALLEQQERARNGLAPAKEKQQKFGILNSPAQLELDLAQPCGALGRAVLYLDLDDFKAINKQLMERVVDRLILPPTHKLLEKCVDKVGSAYGEGGDEFIILLPNASEGMAIECAQAVRREIANLRFEEEARDIRVTASVGVAYGGTEVDQKVIAERANEAKNCAKDNGKNCVAVWAKPECRIVK